MAVHNARVVRVRLQSVCHNLGRLRGTAASTGEVLGEYEVLVQNQ